MAGTLPVENERTAKDGRGRESIQEEKEEKVAVS